MELNSKSKSSDALGNLYRSALFMIKGQTNLSISFYQKAYHVLKEKMPTKIVNAPKNKETLTKKQRLLLAEKILDQYLFFKNAQKKLV